MDFAWSIEERSVAGESSTTHEIGNPTCTTKWLKWFKDFRTILVGSWGGIDATPDFYTMTDNSLNEGSSNLHLQSMDLLEDLGDTMSYPYSKYNDEADTKVHICSLLTTLQRNHKFQRLSSADVDVLKIHLNTRLFKIGNMSHFENYMSKKCT